MNYGIEIYNNNEKNSFYSILKKSYNYSDIKLAESLYNDDEEEEERIYEMQDDDLLLGFKNKMFRRGEEVVVNIKLIDENNELKSRNFLIIGKKGSGKSVMGAVVADMFINKFKTPVFAIDPFGEMHVKYKEFFYDGEERYLEYLDSFLKYYNLKRRGLKLTVIAPAFIGEQRSVNFYYKLSYKTVKEMIKYDSGQMRGILSRMLGIKDNVANMDLLAMVMSDVKINTWNDLLRSMSRSKDSKVRIIFSSINAKLKMGVLTNDEKEDIDLCKLMMDNQMVIFKSRIRTEVDDDYDTLIYNSFLELCLFQLTTYMTRHLEGLSSKLQSDNGILIVIDEADSVAPAVGNCSIRNPIVQLATKWRKSLFNIILMVQSATKLDPTFSSQSDYLIGYKSENINKQVLLDRGISEEVFKEVLTELKQEQTTIVNTKVNECFIIGMNNEIKICTPMFPLADIYRNVRKFK